MICALAYSALAESRAVKPLQEWRGRIDNASVGLAPARGYFANQGELDRLWAAWRIPGPCPKVDFKTQLMLVRTCNCSQISVAPLLKEKGNLQVQVTITKDLREDTGYILVLIPRQGIRSIDGKPLEAD
ncbi:MAG: hypothetical protein PHU44_00670 [Syntrophales bacterium]|nr:hypothetical protein [Syntrophales bacterium]